MLSSNDSSLIYNIVKYLDTSWWQIDVWVDAVGKQMSVRVVSVKDVHPIQNTGCQRIRPKHGLHIGHPAASLAFIFVFFLLQISPTPKNSFHTLDRSRSPPSLLLLSLFKSLSVCILICFSFYSCNILLEEFYA